MNRRKLSIIMMVLLATTLITQTGVAASTPPDPDPCQGVTDKMLKNLSAMDSPASRAEYAMMERVANCMAVAGISISKIPKTGSGSGSETGYKNPALSSFKERQAEKMSAGIR